MSLEAGKLQKTTKRIKTNITRKGLVNEKVIEKYQRFRKKNVFEEIFSLIN